MGLLGAEEQRDESQGPHPRWMAPVIALAVVAALVLGYYAATAPSTLAPVASSAHLEFAATDAACEDCQDFTEQAATAGAGRDRVSLFATASFPRRWNCGSWPTALGWLHIISDIVIWGAYLAIPTILVIFVRKRRESVPFSMVWVLFAAFVLFCGVGHLIEAAIFWWPVYRLAGFVKLLTALVSAATTLALIRVLPVALTLRTPTQLERVVKERTQELEELGAKLQSINEELEDRVAERTLELTRSNHDLEQFAYVASHDLQEPLRMVTSYMQLVEERYADVLDDDGRQYIGFATDGATRMAALIRDLLLYSRVGEHSGEVKPVDLQQVVGDVEANLAITIEATRAELVYDSLPTVLVDKVQLTQLMQNLIGNALKFCDENAPLVEIDAEPLGDQWQIRVRDNGIGIDPKHADRVFQVFQRLHRVDQYQGTGIGLAICKKLVERNNGEIWALPREGGGTDFCFTLPRIEHARTSIAC